MTAEVFHAVTDGIRLQELGTVDQFTEVLRIEERGGKIIEDLAVGCGVPLMHFHDPGEDVEVILTGKPADGGQGREGLEAELGKEAIMMLPVGRKGLIAVPDAPVMGISAVFSTAVFKVSAGGGGGWPVEGVRRFLGDDPWNQVLKQTDVIIELFAALRPGIEFILCLKLIVSAPQAKARVIAQAADILPHFGIHIPDKVRAELIGGAGEHHVLPDQQAFFIAEIIEKVIREVAAAPDADAVEVALLRGGKEQIGPLTGDPGKEIVLRNIVSTHGKDLQAVDLKGEIASFQRFVIPGKRELLPFTRKEDQVRAIIQVRRLAGHVGIKLLTGHGIRIDGQGAQADAAANRIEDFAVFIPQLCRDGVQGLRAVPVGPPELRMVYLNGQEGVNLGTDDAGTVQGLV